MKKVTVTKSHVTSLIANLLCAHIKPCLLTVGTHDIQNVTVTTKPSLPGQIRIKGDFVANAAANGAFVIVYSLTDYSDVHYIAKQDEETIDINIMNLPGTEYNVSVFSLENGRPFERAVSSTKRVTVTTTGDQGLQCDIHV